MAKVAVVGLCALFFVFAQVSGGSYAPQQIQQAYGQELPVNCPFHQEPISLKHPQDTVEGTINQDGNYAFNRYPDNMLQNGNQLQQGYQNLNRPQTNNLAYSRPQQSYNPYQQPNQGFTPYQQQNQGYNPYQQQQHQGHSPYQQSYPGYNPYQQNNNQQRYPGQNPYQQNFPGQTPYQQNFQGQNPYQQNFPGQNPYQQNNQNPFQQNFPQQPNPYQQNFPQQPNPYQQNFPQQPNPYQPNNPQELNQNQDVDVEVYPEEPVLEYPEDSNIQPEGEMSILPVQEYPEEVVEEEIIEERVQENDPEETRDLIVKSTEDIENIYIGAQEEIKESELSSAKKTRQVRNNLGNMAFESQGIVYGNHREEIMQTREQVAPRSMSRSLFSSLSSRPATKSSSTGLGGLLLWPFQTSKPKTETPKKEEIVFVNNSLLKATSTASKLAQDGKVSKPAEVINKVPLQATKPPQEVKKITKPVQEISKQITKPTQETNEVAKPAQETNKIVKPAEDVNNEIRKPAQEANKIVKPAEEINNEIRKPDQGANKIVKPTEEINNEIRKPAQETNKHAKSAQEVPKLVLESNQSNEERTQEFIQTPKVKENSTPDKVSSEEEVISVEKETDTKENERSSEIINSQVEENIPDIAKPTEETNIIQERAASEESETLTYIEKADEPLLAEETEKKYLETKNEVDDVLEEKETEISVAESKENVDAAELAEDDLKEYNMDRIFEGKEQEDLSNEEISNFFEMEETPVFEQEEESNNDVSLPIVEDVEGYNSCLIQVNSNVRNQAEENAKKASQCIAVADERRKLAVADAANEINNYHEGVRDQNEIDAQELNNCATEQSELCRDERNQLQSTVTFFATATNTELARATFAEETYAQEVDMCVAAAEAADNILREQADEEVEQCGASENAIAY